MVREESLILSPHHMATRMDPSFLSAVIAGNMDKVRRLLDEDRTRLNGRTIKGNNILHIAANLGNDWLITEACNNSELGLLLHQNLKGDTILHCAARAGHDHILSLLIDHGVGLQMTGVLNQRGDSALHEAARGGHAKVVRQLLAVGENMASMVNGDGESPLYLAAARGSVNIVEMLLRCVGVEYGGPGGQTALHAAVCGSHGSNQYFNNRFNRDGESLLHYLVTEVARSEMYALRTMYVMPPFLFLSPSAMGHFYSALRDVVQLFLNQCVMGYFSSTPRRQIALRAASYRSYDIARMLLESKPELNQQADASQSVPIHYVVSHRDVKIVRLLLQANPTVAHLLDNNGLSAIHIAASKDYTEVIREILCHCPDAIELIDRDGNNFLHVAANKEATAVVKLVLSNPLFRHSINEINHEGNTPLHLAAMNHNIEIVQLLLSNSRVNKNVINCEGLTPLDVALSIDASKFGFRRTKMIKALRSAGTKFDLRRMDIMMSEDQGCSEEELDRHRAMTNNLALVAVLIATVTFAAAFTLPGGYNSNDSNQRQGMAILAKKLAFKVFLISDTIAMISSMFVAFLLIYSSSPDYNSSRERDLRMGVIIIAMRFLQVALGGMLVAFSMGIYVVVVSQCSWLAYLICGMTICFPIIVWILDDLIWAHWLKQEKSLRDVNIL